TPFGDDGAAPQTEEGHALPLDGTAAHALPVPRRADDRRGGPQPLTRASRQLLQQRWSPAASRRRQVLRG
ncbi:hypothetical protein T484DRAFT_1901847, partial [Baffinella frigidus]